MEKDAINIFGVKMSLHEGGPDNVGATFFYVNIISRIL